MFPVFTRLPSTYRLVLAIPAGADAVTAITTIPLTVAPSAGLVMLIVGGLVGGPGVGPLAEATLTVTGSDVAEASAAS